MSTQDEQKQLQGAGTTASDSHIMMMIHQSGQTQPQPNMSQGAGATQPMSQGAGATQSSQVGGGGSSNEVESPQQPGSANSKKRAGRRKINIEFIQDKSRRHITFSKRKAGIMKKAYELSTLTGTQVLLLVASETGHVYTFATPKLQPLITQTEGKNLIQQCLNAPEASQQQLMNGGDEDDEEEGDEDDYQGGMMPGGMMPGGMQPQMMGQQQGMPAQQQMISQNPPMMQHGSMPQNQQMMTQGNQQGGQVPQQQQQQQYYNQSQQGGIPPQQRIMNQAAVPNNGMSHFQVQMNNQQPQSHPQHQNQFNF